MKTSFEVAEWLNKEATSKEFLEVFAYLYEASNGRGIQKGEKSVEYLKNIFSDDRVCETLKYVIERTVEEL